MDAATHYIEADEKAEPTAFGFTKEEAVKAVKQALKWFGIVKRAQVFCLPHAELLKKVGIEGKKIQALVHFDPNQTEVEFYFTEFCEDLLHCAFHEASHLFFQDINRAIKHLEEVQEKLVDTLAMLVLRRRRKK